MNQCPSWEANRFSASQRNSPQFTEPEGSLPHSQVAATALMILIIPVRASLSLFLKTQLNITLPSTPGSPKCSLFPPGFRIKTLYTHLASPIPATCPARLILLNLITRVIITEIWKYSCRRDCLVPNFEDNISVAVESEHSHADACTNMLGGAPP